MQRSMKRILDKERVMSKPTTNAENLDLIVYKIDELKLEVSAINSKLERDYVRSKEMDKLREEAQDREQRIRIIESKIWTASGVAGVLGAVASYLISYVMKVI